MRIVIGLDNGRELEIDSNSVDEALLQAASAYPDATVIGIQVRPSIEETDATETTDADGDSE